MAAPRGPGSTQEELLGISASVYVSPHWAQNVDVEGQIIKKIELLSKHVSNSDI